MDMKYKLVLKASMGFSLGLIIFLIFAIFSIPEDTNSELNISNQVLYTEVTRQELIGFTFQLFISGLYGALAMGGSIVYEIESWSILKSTAIHYLTILISYYVMCFTLRWFSPSDMFINAIIFLAFTIVYIMIWLIQYYRYKIEIKKINMKLEGIKADMGKQKNECQ